MSGLPEISTFEGYPVITLNPADAFPFSFGATKARLFMAELHKIKSHYAEYSALAKKYRDASLMKATLTLGLGGNYPVELTMKKCKLITDHVGAIESFLKQHG